MKNRTVIPLAIALSLASSASTRSLAGCYELQLFPWRPAIALGEDSIFVSPPPRVELTTTPDHTWNERGFKVIPTGGVSDSIFKHPYWTSDSDQVHIVWTTGFSGFGMDLRERGNKLEGTAYTHWDFTRPRQTSDVVATKASCANK